MVHNYEYLRACVCIGAATVEKFVRSNSGTECTSALLKDSRHHQKGITISSMASANLGRL